MSIDINAFRAIANQNPDKLVYVQGETLKTTRNKAHHGEHTYKAAADAFLSVSRQHYGAALGDALKRYLEAEGNAGKPLTARTVKALIAFADEKMGSSKTIDAGGKAIDLSKVGTDSMSRTGFRQATKIAKAEAGQRSAASATLAALKFDEKGKVDIPALLRHLNTFHAYIDRETTARGLSTVRPVEPIPDPGAPGAEAAAPKTGKEMLSDAEIEHAKLFEKGFFTAVDAMDNNTLSAVYQGLISKETDAFKKELARIINHPDAKPQTIALAEKAFTDLSRIEAMTVSEISRRMILDKTPDDQKANVPSLMERYAGEGAEAANHYAVEGDMTTINLGIMARSAAQGSNDAKTTNVKTDETLKSHGMGAVDSKKIGDMLRSQELTINMHFATLMGKRKDGSQGTPLLQRPGAHVTNAFESLEEQNIEADATQEYRFRNQVEKSFFPEYSAKPLAGKDRPVYGALNTAKLTGGAADTNIGIYGRVVVVLKPHVKQKCTYTLDDTFFATRLSMPESKRAEIEENLVAAFASRLKDPAAALAALRDPQNPAAVTLTRFFNDLGADLLNFSAKRLDGYTSILSDFLKAHAVEGAEPITTNDVATHFVEKYVNENASRTMVADYDHIENLLAQQSDFTAVSMGIATLKSEANPKTAFAVEGTSYLEAQIHSPVLLDRDVEEIRIDVCEMEDYFENEFDALPQEERNGLVRADWVAARIEEAKEQIKSDASGASCKVTFYNHEDTSEAEADLALDTTAAISTEAVGHLKDDLVAIGNTFFGERRAELMNDVRKTLSLHIGKEAIYALCGQNVEQIPDWLQSVIDADMRKSIAGYGKEKHVASEAKVFSDLKQKITDVFGSVWKLSETLDKNGINDEEERLGVMKEFFRLGLRGGSDAIAFAQIHAVGKKALADVNALARETFEKDIEHGAEIMRNAFGGMPPFAGIALDTVKSRIQNEIALIKNDLASDKHMYSNAEPKNVARRLREKVVKPFIEKKARIMQSQVFMKFPSEAERNAFLLWATSAGKLKNSIQFEGVYEGSSLLVDALEAKIKSGAPLKPQDLVDCYKAFFPTCFDYMEDDSKQSIEYGPDDRMCFTGRITSVAMSRLALRVGREGLAKLAAVLDTPEGRSFHSAVLRGSDNNVLDRNGTLETAGAFMETLYSNLSRDYGFAFHRTSDIGLVDYACVPPAARALAAQISPIEAQMAEEAHPYNPAASGAIPLSRIPAPANPAAMPRDNAARKRFLLHVLPVYHEHEKTFDYGTNYHGRTHATRSFVFSIAMGNILKEKGVAVDMNAVALATAGHDTGRMNNGRDTLESESRSADAVNAAVDTLYPNAAGDAWKNQIKANITTESANQNTVEGYLFKCADSLDYSRIDDLNEKYFPFLRKPIVTEDGLVIASDSSLRSKLMKEAKLLSDLTSPNSARHAEIGAIQNKIIQLDQLDAPENAVNAMQNIKEQVANEVREQEKHQTDTMSDEQIVEMVENAIRSRPQDFPLLTKYYLDAEA